MLSPLGTIQVQAGQIDDGIYKLLQSLKLNPSQPVALNNIGNAYLELKKYDLAYKALMNLWEKLFPNRILTIDYEKNVEDPEFWAKKND